MANRNFSRLIKRHSQATKVIKEVEGYKDGPNWIPGKKIEYIADLAVFNLTSNDLKNYDGGKYSKQDIKVYAPDKLVAKNQDTQKEEVIELEEEDIVEANNNKHKIDEVDNRTRHADFIEYVAKKQVIDDE